MFTDYSDVCSFLEAQLKKVETVLRKGCIIGTAMVFDSRAGELVILLHSDLEWYNDDNRKEFHILLRGNTYKGSTIQEVLEEVKQAYSI